MRSPTSMGCWGTKEGPALGYQGGRGLKDIAHRERLREMGLFSLAKGRLGPSKSCLQLPRWELYRQSRQTLSALADRIRKSSGHKRQHGKLQLDTMTSFFTRRVVKSRNRLPRGAVDSLSLGAFMA